MVNGRRGNPASDSKIKAAIENAKTIEEVYAILDRSRLNLTSAEERKVARDWNEAQNILKSHGKGAYASSPVAEVA